MGMTTITAQQIWACPDEGSICICICESPEKSAAHPPGLSQVEYKEFITSYMYSSAAINIDTNGRVCGAPVQFGCYQHRHE